MNKKTFAFVLAAAVLGLAACNGGGGAKSDGGASKATSSQKASSSKKSSSKRSSTSRAPVPSMSVASIDVVAKENKLYVEFKGTCVNYKAEDFKWAFGLQGAETWLVGSETPADADYKQVVAFDDKGAFTADFNISDIEGITAGNYTIWAGAKGAYSSFEGLSEASGAKDNKFRGYTRADNGAAVKLYLDALPPISLTEATVIKDNDKICAKIGGETTLTQEQIDGLESFLDFQCIEQYSLTRINKLPAEPEEGGRYYHYVKEGTKAYIVADISWMTPGRTYSTHFNVMENKSANCFMEGNINKEYKFEEDNLSIVAYANPSAGQAGGGAEFWGCLGFKVNYITEPAPEVDPTVE